MKIDENRIFILNYEKKKTFGALFKYRFKFGYFSIQWCYNNFRVFMDGVPVIILKGDRFISRCGYSINKNAGLKDFTADTKEDYISIALDSY